VDSTSDSSPGARRSRLLSYLELTKPAVTRLVLVTMACGAIAAPGTLDLRVLAFSMVGTLLVVGAANALNMYAERDVDALMDRTKLRPLPAGQLAPRAALVFGIVTATVGLVVLALLVNALTAALAAVALLSYVLVYTPLKRVTHLAMHVGAVPGAIPPLMGWASMVGELDPSAWSLFAILYVWQLPHFSAIAIFRSSDYERAGVRVLPVAYGLSVTKWSIVGYLVLLLAVSLLPALTGLAGAAYALIAAASGGIFVGFGLFGLRRREGASWARGLFLVSMPYLVLVYVAAVVSAVY
jgi:protoheme IX farnesyltransferase